MSHQSGRIVDPLKLRALCDDRLLSFAQLGRDSELSYSCVKKIIDGKKRVHRTLTIRAIANALSKNGDPVSIDQFSRPVTASQAIPA